MKETALILEVIRVVEALRDWHAIEMPFAGVVASVAGGLEKLWQELGPGRSLATPSAADTGHGIAAHLLGVIAGENGGAGGPATGGVVKL